MFHIDLIRFLFIPHLMCVCLYKILICIFVALDQKQIKIKTFNFGDTWQIRLHRTFHFYLFGNWSNVKKVVENVHVSLMWNEFVNSGNFCTHVKLTVISIWDGRLTHLREMFKYALFQKPNQKSKLFLTIKLMPICGTLRMS